MQNGQQTDQPQAQPEQPAVYGPAPAAPFTPYQQQPVNQQYFAQPQAAPVQYVVMAQSMKGLKGWLLFFAICFAISGLTFIGYFFNSMQSLDSASSVVMLIFAPLLAIAYITSTVFIAMQKKLGKWLAIGSLGLATIYGIISLIVGFASGVGATNVAVLVSAIITQLVVEGLLMLYFFTSRRVKETLVN